MGTPTGPFRRTDRLLRPREFEHATRHGRRAAVRGFVVFAVVARGSSGLRLGITVSRRVGGAVTRSLVKRRVREWFRRERSRLGGNIDLVVIGRPSAGELSWPETCRALSEAARQVEVLAS